MNGFLDWAGLGGIGSGGTNMSNFLNWGSAAGNAASNAVTGGLTDAATNAGGGIFGGLLGNMGDFLNSDAFKLMAALGMTGWGLNQQQNNYKDQMKFAKTAFNQGQKNYETAREDNKAIADRENQRFTSVVQQDPNTGEYYVTKATDTPDINWA
jgi:hypothetical protein